jgi:hypothetical protein
MSRRWVWGIVVAVAVAFAAGWVARGAADEQSARQAVLARSLERVTFAGAAITLTRSEHADRLDALLANGMTGALETAEREVAAGTRLPHEYDFPSLQSGLDRAASAAESAGDTAAAARLRSLQTTLLVRP